MKRGCLAVTYSTQSGNEDTHTFSVFLFTQTVAKQNQRTDRLMHIQSAAGSTHGTKVLIASHLPVRGQTGAAEFDWEPAVGGSSQLHNTCLSNQTVFFSGAFLCTKKLIHTPNCIDPVSVVYKNQRLQTAHFAPRSLSSFSSDLPV